MSQQKPEFIRDALLDGILRGEFGAEDAVLPREQDLAPAFDVARPTLRAGIQALQALGVVAVTHGRPGARVRPMVEWHLLDRELLETVLDSPLGRELLGEALEWRRLVVPEAAGLAAERATKDDLARLEAALDALRSARRPAVGTRPGPALEFHRALVEAAHNRFLARATLPLETALADRLRRRRGGEGEAAVVTAIRERDPAAAREAARAWLGAMKPARTARGG
jgi:GntR family transcriptional regulator, galactonate operon transcriptional repressor